MSIFDLSKTDTLDKFINTFSETTNETQSQEAVFTGLLLVKTISGRFKPKIIKIIGKKLLFSSVFVSFDF